MSNKSTTPLVDSLKLPLVHTDAFAIAPGGLYVNIKDLEACLEKLPKVQGAQLEGHGWCMCENAPVENATHTARLLGIQEITKEPVKVEHIVSFPEGHRCYAINGEEFGSKLAGKIFKVTYEEFER